jgi:prepilin-type N-terminal cleavage/methylation domain-containing protein
MFVKKPRFSERGDTLVEVLIAIAVISLILGGAFVMTNRSLQGTRDAQERVNATKLTEGQVERIKGLAATNGLALFGASTPATYCINNTGVVVSSTNVACTVDVNGNPTTAEPSFQLAITRSGNTFTIRSTWTNVRGDTQNNVEMKYRVYEQ